MAGCAPAGNSPTSGDRRSTEAASGDAADREVSADPADPRWLPSPGASWQWQLSGALDLTVEAGIFDVDYETLLR
ncbi:hypothetical protein QNO00_09035 [Arthrobacter sp. zg-Y1219]|uniref:hypothetical protein n=1 Tax=Arthrobacter sp. zg-Y1219 TaxID=3049067 RepID=UPI0024C3C31B|nr:hypothetical protein [Arthrobacter sp. zg-Y1219]MDK1360411.1 hypothetical protein [Arthrobacter sp. zg-Y1219]